MGKLSAAVNWFFKDKHGHWAIMQWPNALLMVWIVLLLINLPLRSRPIGLVQSAVLFTWAYLEITQGISRFRKTLGAVILVGIIVSYFF